MGHSAAALTRTLLILFSTLVASVWPQMASACAFVERQETTPRKSRLIIFVHGLGSNIKETFTNEVSGKKWPEIILSDTSIAPNFDVCTYQYDTDVMSNNFDIKGMADGMYANLSTDPNVQSYSDIVFVVHSLGGVVVRETLLDYPDLRNRTKGIMLFGTPMSGSSTAEWAKDLLRVSRATKQLGYDINVSIR